MAFGENYLQLSPPCNFALKNSHGSAWELARGLFVETSDSDSVKDTARRKRLWIFSKSEIIHHRARKSLMNIGSTDFV